MKNNPLLEQSKRFAVDCELLCQNLDGLKSIANAVFQLRKSSSSVFANVTEAQYPQSLPDMLSKFNIALKECAESESWLTLLFETRHMQEELFKDLRNKCGRIRRMLISSCNTIRKRSSI